MKTINKIKIAVILIFTALIFTACGGGGSEASFSNAQQKDLININCISNPSNSDIESYIILNSGDTLVKEDNNATVSIYHDVDGIKRVCRESGSSYILRAN